MFIPIMQLPAIILLELMNDHSVPTAGPSGISCPEVTERYYRTVSDSNKKSDACVKSFLLNIPYPNYPSLFMVTDVQLYTLLS